MILIKKIKQNQMLNPKPKPIVWWREAALQARGGRIRRIVSAAEIRHQTMGLWIGAVCLAARWFDCLLRNGCCLFVTLRH